VLLVSSHWLRTNPYAPLTNPHQVDQTLESTSFLLQPPFPSHFERMLSTFFFLPLGFVILPFNSLTHASQSCFPSPPLKQPLFFGVSPDSFLVRIDLPLFFAPFGCMFLVDYILGLVSLCKSFSPDLAPFVGRSSRRGFS